MTFAAAQTVLLELQIIQDVVLLGLLVLLLANGAIPVGGGSFVNMEAFEVVNLVTTITD